MTAYLGYVKGGLANADAIAAQAVRTGQAPALVNQGLGPPPNLPNLAGLDAIVAGGAIPVQGWSLKLGAGTTGTIASGQVDDHLRACFGRWRDWGKSALFRPCHEMNGDWYDWSDQAPGNAPGDYVAAWRHLRAVAAEVGCTNLTWAWCPNVIGGSTTPLEQLYPGDEQVGWLAMDGYNWGADRWLWPADVFGPTLDALRALCADKPVAILETGCATDARKPHWLAALGEYVLATPTLAALAYSDETFGEDVTWPLDDPPAALDAWREATARAGLWGGPVVLPAPPAAAAFPRAPRVLPPAAWRTPTEADYRAQVAELQARLRDGEDMAQAIADDAAVLAVLLAAPP